MPKDTQSLAEQASRGDAAAIESLLAEYLPAIKRYLRKNAPRQVLARETESDLAQSVCREALYQLGRERFEYRGEAEFRQWFYRAAELKLKNRLRFYNADRRNADRETGRGAASALEGPARESLYRSILSPSAAAVKNEDMERFGEALDGLDERGRAIVILYYLDGLGHAAIAEQFGITESHSRTLLSRSLARLARLARPNP
ncbi:MAG: sigma-70 family RNA polymerase sigma factor [bacterium]|nr:sigma-70 family RNA polymerase sigma factor [bacterium]